MFIDFERTALYQEVCASPITALAAKYGLSDSGLRKICVLLDIPLPGRGHWQKLAAGKPSKVPALRPTKGRTKYRCAGDDTPAACSSGVRLAITRARIRKGSSQHYRSRGHTAGALVFG